MSDTNVLTPQNTMSRDDYVKNLVKENYKKYNLRIPYEKLKWSGELVDVELADGTIEIVDRLVEFTLCKLNSFYFIDRYCYTNHPKHGYVPFKLHDFQKKALEEFQKNSKIIFRKARQVGASVISGAYALWKANFYKKQTIKVISLTKDDAIEFKDKTIDLNYEKMPGFLKAKAKAGRMGRTKLELQNGSIIQVLPKSKNAGRGSTPSLVIIDEAAFNEWMDDIWKAVEPALDKGGDIIVISTTNGVGNWYHITYTRAEESLNEFHPIFIPWWRYPGRDNPWLDELLEKQKSGEWDEEYIQKFVKKKETEQLSYKGSPKKAPWLWIRRANAKSEQEFNQEIMADFLGSGATVIPFERIEKMEDNCIKPKWKDVLPQDDNNEIIPGLWVWRDRKPNSMYMLTVDTATGHGKDYSVMEVIDVYEREQVAEYKWQVPTDEMGRLVKKIARYYNNAYVVIECNHPGPATFNEVYKHKTDPYYNMYIKTKSGQPWSWDTTTKSRILLIEDFYKDILNGHTKIYSQRFVEEVKTFIWTEGGKPEAARNNNDDLIMAYAFYAHLVENVFSSRPAAIHTNQKVVDVDSMNAYDEDWEEKEDFYKGTHGMTLIDYYWMQGWSLPDDYIKWKNAVREEEINSANQANRSVLEDNAMKNDLGLEKAPEWVKR